MYFNKPLQLRLQNVVLCAVFFSHQLEIQPCAVYPKWHCQCKDCMQYFLVLVCYSLFQNVMGFVNVLAVAFCQFFMFWLLLFGCVGMGAYLQRISTAQKKFLKCLFVPYTRKKSYQLRFCVFFLFIFYYYYLLFFCCCIWCFSVLVLKNLFGPNYVEPKKMPITNCVKYWLLINIGNKITCTASFIIVPMLSEIGPVRPQWPSTSLFSGLTHLIYRI